MPHKKESVMSDTSSDREKYLAAKAHVEAIKGFYIHLSVFVAVMIALIGVDYVGGGSWWVQWPLIGWGIGVLAHAFMVFSPNAISTKSWEDRKIKETIAKMH
jgi:uncharacterized membrane protein